MLFDGWDKLIRVAVVVTVAFGSILSTVLPDKDVSLSVGLAALSLLVVLQPAITWCAVRSPFVNAAVKTMPALRLLDASRARARSTASRRWCWRPMAACRRFPTARRGTGRRSWILRGRAATTTPGRTSLILR